VEVRKFDREWVAARTSKGNRVLKKVYAVAEVSDLLRGPKDFTNYRYAPEAAPMESTELAFFDLNL
jgi:hypothetical protein